jgi:hypothetical protein
MSTTSPSTHSAFTSESAQASYSASVMRTPGTGRPFNRAAKR